MLTCVLHKIWFQPSLSSFSIPRQPPAPCPSHNTLFSIPECVGYFFTPLPFSCLVISSSCLLLKCKNFLGCVFTFLLSVSFSLDSLIYSYWCWGIPSLNIQPSPSPEFHIWFVMVYWIPPYEFIYLVIHLLINLFSIYLKCTRGTLLHSEADRADIIILIFRSVNWDPERLTNVLKVRHSKSLMEQ